MPKIKVGIVEDDMLIAQGIAATLMQLGYDAKEPAVNYTQAIAMIERDQPDILLLDIHLSGRKDGIDVALKVKEDYNIPFIFLTANADASTVDRAKKLSPPAYLVKPFNKDDLYTSIEICLHNFATSNKKTDLPDKGNYVIKDCLFIKQGQYFHKTKIEDILYLESDNVYVNVHTTGGKLMVRSSIQAYLELIGGTDFVRVHRSYAINIRQIDTINSDTLYIKGIEIPIGKTYRDQLLGFLRLG